MKFHTLTVQNFLTLREATVNLADRGLQLIQGVNDDDSSATSNGSGKSSLVDAISWVLFGATARDVKGDAVVNLAAKKDCMVILTLSNGTTTYKIERYRKHATGKNTLCVYALAKDPAEPSLDLSKGTDTETQKVLEKILGCSREVFMAAIYSGQEAMPDLPRMKDRELKTLIEEAAGLQRIELAYEMSRTKLRECDAMLASAKSTLDFHRNQLNSSIVFRDEIGEKVKAWDDNQRIQISETEKLLNAKVVAVNAAKEESLAFTKMPHDLAVTETKEINVALEKHRDLEAKAASAERELNKLERSFDKHALINAMADVEKLKAQIANAVSEIKKPCGECGTVLETMSIEEFIGHKAKHLKASKLKLEEIKIAAVAHVALLAAEKAKALKARSEVPEVTELAKRLALLSIDINAHKDKLAQILRLENDCAAVSTSLTVKTSTPNAYAATEIVSLEKVVEHGAIAENSAKQVPLKQAEYDTALLVSKVFGPAGVRAQILDTVTPFLNCQTSDYLSALSDGEITATWTTLTRAASGDLKEKFSIDVVHAKGGESFSALSGGEKRKVRLSTALALQDLMASRATQSIDLFIGDEIDDALDPAGLERLMTILERRARERGTVLVISHSDLKDWCDNVTTVRKSALWTSTVEGSLCS